MSGTFKESILSTNIQLRPFEYNQSIDDILLEKLKKKVEGKCDKNGYIKPKALINVFGKPIIYYLIDCKIILILPIKSI